MKVFTTHGLLDIEQLVVADIITFVVALLLMRALGGCGAPPVDARGCVAACGREVDACLARCSGMATDVDGGE